MLLWVGVPVDGRLGVTLVELDFTFISTGMRNGSSASPTALRACAPHSGPKTPMMRSVKPLMTAGCRLKPGAELTIPNTRDQQAMRARPPVPASGSRGWQDR